MNKFAYKGDLSSLTVESIKSFMGGVLDGSIKPHLKSESIPETQGPVTILVGDSWSDIVMDPSKDVLVEYYAPWCGHCKKLSPIWDELGEHVSDIEDLVIAKFDATVNEVTGLAIKGYPTLKWYPKDDKSGDDYEGERELDGFKSFLSKKSSAYQNH